MTDDGSCRWEDEIVRVNSHDLPVVGGRVVRAQHPKHHGCARAVFRPLDVPEDLRVGVFAVERELPALVRFSNGRRFDDRKSDAHGMAIKLLLPDDMTGASAAQDFVLVDHETFFTGDLPDYARVNVSLRGRSLYRRLPAALRLLLSPRTIAHAIRFATSRIGSPLEAHYFSTTPYRLGDALVKYVVRPASGTRRGEASSGGPDRLRLELERGLAAGPVEFDLGVDLRTDPRRQPVEDPTVAWSAMPGARREWLARLTLPQQDIAPNDGLAENLLFSPWHALPEHEPVGRINAIRRRAYARAGEHRHRRNGIAPPPDAGAPARYEPPPRAVGNEGEPPRD